MSITSLFTKTAKTQPYTALALEGRDIYLREGCYTCHSQMIRPLRADTSRYGARSLIDDSIWDHPFQWGSKRTGPDLARVGGKSPAAWHYLHMRDPRATSKGSNMPAYPQLLTDRVNLGRTSGKLAAMRMLGVPYTQAQIDGAHADALAEGQVIADELAKDGYVVTPDAEIVAVIAYLQSLGKQLPPPDDAAEVAAPATGGP